MTKERGNGSAAADRFAGLLSWWGMTDAAQTGPFEARLKRLQGFLGELQRAYGEAYGRQMEALFAANEHFARAAQDLMRSRQPADVMAAESALMSALMEEAAAQAKSWSQLVQRLTACCAEAAGATAEATRETGAAAARPATPRPAPGGGARARRLQTV